MPLAENVNKVKAIYAPFTDEEISDRISDLLTPEDMQAEVKIIFQSVDGLHNACPNHLGDWYFTGDFPTPGGHRVVNKGFRLLHGRQRRARLLTALSSASMRDQHAAGDRRSLDVQEVHARGPPGHVPGLSV